MKQADVLSACQELAEDLLRPAIRFMRSDDIEFVMVNDFAKGLLLERFDLDKRQLAFLLPQIARDLTRALNMLSFCTPKQAETVAPGLRMALAGKLAIYLLFHDVSLRVYSTEPKAGLGSE